MADTHPIPPKKTPEEIAVIRKKREFFELKARIIEMRTAHKAALDERRELEGRAAKMAAELGLPFMTGMKATT